MNLNQKIESILIKYLEERQPLVIDSERIKEILKANEIRFTKENWRICLPIFVKHDYQGRFFNRGGKVYVKRDEFIPRMFMERAAKRVKDLFESSGKRMPPRPPKKPIKITNPVSKEEKIIYVESTSCIMNGGVQSRKLKKSFDDSALLLNPIRQMIKIAKRDLEPWRRYFNEPPRCFL